MNTAHKMLLLGSRNTISNHPTLTDNIISYWRLDEASGVRVDSHGSNDLTDNNTVLFGDGIIGNGADFEADNSEYLSHADNASLSTGDIDFAFTLWFKLESKTDLDAIISKNSSANAADTEYTLDLGDGSGIRWITGGVGSTVATETEIGDPALDTLYFAYMYHDATANEIGISLNDGTVFTAATGANVVPDTTGSFIIGNLTTLSRYLDGIADEVGFWKKVPTADEITFLYNDGLGVAFN